MKTVFLLSVFIFGFASTALAQVNPKREACLQEAQAKGLYTTGTRNAGTANSYMAPQRRVFMKECMARR